jgi:Fe-Mn family superoxide dismutase
LRQRRTLWRPRIHSLKPSRHHSFTIRKILQLTKNTKKKIMSGKIILNSGLRAAVNLGSSKLPTEVAKSSAALLSSVSGTKHTLPDLPYDYNALEPVISAETMTLHHSKHHNTYVTNLNAAIEKLDSAMMHGDVSATIALQGALKFNGGGHINHTLFWENLSPDSSYKTDGVLAEAINERFGSIDNMKSEMGASTIAVQGSGWGWLGYNPKTGAFSCEK